MHLDSNVGQRRERVVVRVRVMVRVMVMVMVRVMVRVMVKAQHLACAARWCAV